MRVESIGDVEYRWFDPISTDAMRIEGFCWLESDKKYRRMPVKTAAPLPASVDSLANCCAGGQIKFRTNTASLAIHAKFADPHGADHMPATCSMGFDCYEGECGAMRYLSTSRFSIAEKEYTFPLFANADKKERLITINTPLYNSALELLEIGIPADATLEPSPEHAKSGTVIVYGTSITQGGCASRPGMCYTNILSRKIDAEFVNLGFSGSGKGEPSVVATIASIPDMRMLVIDYEANVGENIYENLIPFIEAIREKHSDLTIVVVSGIMYGKFNIDPTSMEMCAKRRIFEEKTVREFREKGDGNIHFIDGSLLLGDDYDDCRVDGVHPTDLGFYRMAKGLEGPIKELLKIN
jgi:hypothetical protein